VSARGQRWQSRLLYDCAQRLLRCEWAVTTRELRRRNVNCADESVNALCALKLRDRGTHLYRQTASSLMPSAMAMRSNVFAGQVVSASVRKASSRTVHAGATELVRVKALARRRALAHTHTHTPTQRRSNAAMQQHCHVHMLHLGPPRRPRLPEQWNTTVGHGGPTASKQPLERKPHSI